MSTWAEMQPRERDAWLAEKACDYVWMRQTGADGVVRRELLPPELADSVSLPRADMTERINMMRLDDYVPHYTTDPAAALQLAEAMRDQRWGITIGLPAEWMVMRPGCAVGMLHANGQHITVRADTPSLAIARAAYLALGGE